MAASIAATLASGLVGAFSIFADYKSGKENESDIDARLEAKYGLIPISEEENSEE